MTTLPRRPAAALAWLLAVGAPVGWAVLLLAGPVPQDDAWAIALYAMMVISSGLTGAFLLTRVWLRRST